MRVGGMIRRQLLLTTLLLATSSTLPAAARAQTAALASRDAVIAGTIHTANEGEITHAHIALERARDPDVRAFASRMSREHAIADEQLRRVLARLAPAEAARPVAHDIETNCAQTAELLRSVPDDAFDVTYMDVQIDRHDWLLRTLDDTLLPRARDATVKAQLRMIRGSVLDHLDRARQIRQRLGS